MKILKKVPKCCGREVDLVAVENKYLYFQCKLCGDVIVMDEDLK